MEVVFILGIGQALFFIFILMTKRDNLIPNRLLILLLSLIGFSLFLNYTYYTGLIKQLPHLVGLDTCFDFLYPPLIFFYTKVLVSKSHQFRQRDFIHLAPFIIYFLYVFVTFYIRSGDYKLEFLQSLQDSGTPLDIAIANYLKLVQAVIYFFLIYYLIKEHQGSIKAQFSYTEKINLNWLKIITIGLGVLYLFKIIAIVSTFFADQIFLGEAELLIDLAGIVFIYATAFFGIKQPEIFGKWQNLEDNLMLNKDQEIYKTDTSISQSASQSKPKYLGSPLTTSESNLLLVKLQEYMLQEQPFLKSQLTIKEVADTLEVNTKYLSQVINEQLGLNFFNFVNQYRIEEVKKRLLDEQYGHLSILGIALDCGFNSKSSFNSIFKKATGQTPSNYKSSTS